MDVKSRKIKNPINDITAGIIIALVSIPIAMGYAQIAGLPVIYGLYGSFLPILVYGVMTTSPQFVVGVDAMPAAMVGTLLATLMLEPGSNEVMSLVPTVSLLVGIWFVIFYLLKAGRIVKYISVPVMGGFISGVGFTIILMQIPKLLGGTPGTGVLPDLIINIIEEFKNYNALSAVLGIGTVVIILVCKKYIPKVPMTVVMMLVGAILQIESADGKIAETIKNTTAGKNQQILTMDSMQSVTAKDVTNGAEYVKIMEANLEVLKQALK